MCLELKDPELWLLVGKLNFLSNIVNREEGLGKALIGKKVAFKAGSGQYGSYAEYTITDV